MNLYLHAKNQLIPAVYLRDTVNFRVQRPSWPWPCFDYVQPKHLPTTFSFFEFLSTCKKWGCFIDLFRRNRLFKNPTIWLAKSILAYISVTRFFPNIGFVQEHSKLYNFSLKNKFKFKKPYFWTIFSPFPQIFGQEKFFQKIWLCHTQLRKGSWHHAEIQRNLMDQFQESTQAYGTVDSIS